MSRWPLFQIHSPGADSWPTLPPPAKALAVPWLTPSTPAACSVAHGTAVLSAVSSADVTIPIAPMEQRKKAQRDHSPATGLLSIQVKTKEPPNAAGWSL